MPDVSVVITTHNRSALLARTLASAARLTYHGTWEVIVVDNNCTDATRQVVVAARATFPAPLHYLIEAEPGKYAALNAGIRHASGAVIANTDDDVDLPADWLACAVGALDRHQCDFVGGPVYPIWEAPPPRWIGARNSLCGKVLALQDHGAAIREYGCGGISWPLGVNVAYRREAFACAGLFDPQLGRVAGTLRNQSQRDWHLRARRAGLRGIYVPDMVVHHVVPQDRMTRRYFYDWFYWHGISRAIMYQTSGAHMLEPDGPETHAAERQLLGVPASLWRRTARATISAGVRWLHGRPDAALEYELQIPFLVGVVRQRLRDRRRPLRTAAPAGGVSP